MDRTSECRERKDPLERPVNGEGTLTLATRESRVTDHCRSGSCYPRVTSHDSLRSSAPPHPIRIGQLMEGVTEAFAPAGPNHLEVGMLFGDVDVALHLQSIAMNADQI
jgi:hypothetical protein